MGLRQVFPVHTNSSFIFTKSCFFSKFVFTFSNFGLLYEDLVIYTLERKISPVNTDNLEEILILTDRYVHLEDVTEIMPNWKVELDLGCGKGGLTVSMAKAFPDRTILAADIMLGRLRKIRKKLLRDQLSNVKLLRVEARFLMNVVLPDQFVDRVHILCPDPWPKLRHRGHRLISSDFMMSVNRVLKEGGIFHFSTDDPEYMQAVVTLADVSGLFERAPDSVLADVADFKTEFERDWLAEGKSVPHIAWRALKKPFTGAH